MGVGTALLIGLIAGAIGTAVFTLIEYADIAATGRPPSMVPGEVAVELTGGDHRADRDRVKRMNWPMHVMHGTGLGVVLGALSLLDLAPVLTVALFYGGLLLSDWMLYVALGITEAPWRWRGSELARELLLKGTFAAAVGVAFYALESFVN
jgi:hypothetical protein